MSTCCGCRAGLWGSARAAGRAISQGERHTLKRRCRKAHPQNAVCLRPVMPLAVRDAAEPCRNIVTAELHNIFRHEARQGGII